MIHSKPMADSTTFDVIAIGDTTQDVFLEMSDASVQCDIDDKNCKICFDYADKIAVDAKDDIPAVGNAANHAIGISRLGLKSAIYTVVGDDTQGHLSADVFKEDGVDSRYVTFDKEHGTNFSAVINFKAERTILVFHEPRTYQLPNFESTNWVYLTSASGDGVEAMHEQTHAYLEENPGVKLAFNPGTHQMHLGRQKLEPLLAKTDCLFLNREESAQVLKVDNDDPIQLIKGFKGLGVKDMVLTDGPKGAYATDGDTVYASGIFDGPVIERTGAGDAYGSGFLAAIIHGKEVTDAMQWGDANATSVVQYVGAREGLLDQKGIDKIIAANSHVKPSKYATL